jgi:hypothetical protein
LVIFAAEIAPSQRRTTLRQYLRGIDAHDPCAGGVGIPHGPPLVKTEQKPDRPVPVPLVRGASVPDEDGQGCRPEGVLVPRCERDPPIDRLGLRQSPAGVTNHVIVAAQGLQGEDGPAGGIGAGAAAGVIGKPGVGNVPLFQTVNIFG